MEDDWNLAAAGQAVRRLTPRECERLQGFPDDWTRWLADGAEQSDSARYRELGNAVAVPVAAWITGRLAAAECPRGSIDDQGEDGRMTRYLRTCGGHEMTVHAPRPGELDPAALAAFTTAEPVLGLDVETSALDDHGPRFFAPGFTVRLVQFGSEREAWVLNMADPGAAGRRRRGAGRPGPPVRHPHHL